MNETTLTISESSYGGVFFTTRAISRNALGAGFQGFIYIGDFALPSVAPVNLPPKNQLQAISSGINYETHVSQVGWMNQVADGAVSGSTGYHLAVEAIRLSSGNPSINQAIRYRTHVQDIGWQDWKTSGQIAGTTGQAKRTEAVQISLNQPVSEYYDIAYRTHIQGIGWQDWVTTGQVAGTTGQAKRLEALQVKLVPKKISQGSTSPSNAGFSYRSHIQSFGWLGYVLNQAISGVTGLSMRLEAFEMIYQGKKDNIQLEGHVEGIGWQTSSGITGTTGQSKRLEAIKIKFKNDLSKKYTIQYRVHVQDVGWQAWKKEGEIAGTTGQAKRLEAIQCQFIPKS
ncbi:hypothetical protein [Pseudolactococcus laudensis]|uniref:hypothetical protein n=1 Tax=Pseudolactococcus laudensis TaxID=1494461 RepID=UPI002FC6AB49